MSYRNDFLEAFLARKKYIPDATPEKYFSYKDLISFNAKKDYSDACRCYEIMERDFLEYYIPLREKNGLPIAHACHVVAYDMLQWMIKNNYCDPRDLAYTVGNISVENQWPYDITEASLMETIRKGHDFDNDVNVHAWLTFRTNYVLDPTILFTLREWKCPCNLGLESHPIQFWNEDNEIMRWELNYKPMLVDSDFYHRVDVAIEVPFQ